MISQALYHELCGCVDCTLSEGLLEYNVDEIQQQFTKPYVLVIHRPSGRGFYLDRQYRHIIDVSNCQEPENPVEVARQHLCKCTNLPAWALQIETVGSYLAERVLEFDSFWLY